VLMVAWMDRPAVDATLGTGLTHFWSRSRKQPWRKGETSGHAQHVERMYADCDADVLLVQVHQDGVACHTGNRTCFFAAIRGAGHSASGGAAGAGPASSGAPGVSRPRVRVRGSTVVWLGVVPAIALAAGCAVKRIDNGVYHSFKGYRVAIPGEAWTPVIDSPA